MRWSSLPDELAFLPTAAILATTIWSSVASAQITLDVTNRESIISAAGIAAAQLRALYPDNETWFVPGQFGLIDGNQNLGYYWWEAGAAMGAWVDYWYYTGDTQYNKMVSYAMQFQVGDDNDYEPANQTLSLGNDDQAFWGLAAMQAAERGFPNPKEDQPSWLALAQAVFNRQIARWDTEHCNGGLRWQVVSTNEGYDYKNSISNGLLMHLGARLARYTANSTYADWSYKIYTWTQEIGLISDSYVIYDGAHIPQCVVSSKLQWTYNAGVYLSGAAYMYSFFQNQTNGAENATYWQEETTKLLNATTNTFFKDNIMTESACERQTTTGTSTCNTDQKSFKSYLARFFGLTYSVAPFTQPFIRERLEASALAAAAQCSGTGNSQSTSGKSYDFTNVCGLMWKEKVFDGSAYGIAKGGVGEQMSAMEVFQSLLASNETAPLSNSTGGTSKGDYNAGTGAESAGDSANNREPATAGDKAGAAILTTICVGALLGTAFWLVRD